MPLVTGRLTDFGLDPMLDNAPKIIFQFTSAGVSRSSILATHPVVSLPARNGYFEAELVDTSTVAPAGYYLVILEWRDDTTRVYRRDVLPGELYVPAAGGVLADLMRVPSNPALVWTGEQPPANPAPGSWWQNMTGDLREYDGKGWNFKVNLRGPAGFMATGAAEDDKAIAAFIGQTAGPSASGRTLQALTAPGYTIPAGPGSGTRVKTAISALLGSFGMGGGEIILAAGEHVWDTPVPIPAAMTSHLTIRGQLGAVIKLTNTGRRAFDFIPEKADQTFRNLTLSDFDVDATASTGRNHIILGNYVNGAFQGRFNVENIGIHRIKTYGAKADPTTVNHATHIHITPRHEKSGEAENQILNVHVSDLHLDGGNTGVIIGGNGPNAGIEVYSDNITIERCYFRGGSVPKVFYTTSGFHVGGKGHCGRIVLRDCVAENSGDNGFEVNAPRDALLDNCLSIDAANVGHYSRNFHPLVDPGHSRIEWRHCRTWIRDFVPDAPNGLLGRGFIIGGTNPFGRVLFTAGCEHQVDTPGDFSEVSSLQIAGVGVAEIELQAFKSRVSNVRVTPDRPYFPTPISLRPGSPTVIRGTFSIEATGTRAGGDEMYFRACSIGGSSTTVDLTGTFDVRLNGFAAHTVYAYDLGEEPDTVIRGKLHAHILPGVVGRGTRIRPGLTVDKGLMISGDYSGLTEGGAEFSGATETQAVNINVGPGTVFKNRPGNVTRPATRSPFTYTNTSMYPELVNVRLDGKTGSAPITGINYAKRGGSAIGTGATGGQFYLQNGDSLTVEYGAGEYPPVIRSQCALPTL